MEKLNRFWRIFKLRLSLLRIWFMKNILLFLRIACVVCLVCIFTGTITAETPLLGSIIYPIFAPLADEINAVIAEKEIDGLMTFFSVLISVMFSISMFAIKARNIAQSDIKSAKLKYAMVQANLYFNSDGKLVKKVEKATGKDINMDGKIDEKDAIEESGKIGFFKGMISAFQEFNTIMKADLSGAEDEESAAYRDVLKNTELEDAAEATKDIEEIIKDGSANFVSDKGVAKAEKELTEVIENDELTEEEKVAKITLLTKVKEWFANIRIRRQNKKDEIEKDDAEILVDNMDADSEYDGSDSLAPRKSENSNEKEDEEVKTVKEQRAEDFLEQLRNRGR